MGGGIVLEEVLDLSFDRLLMMMMMKAGSFVSLYQSCLACHENDYIKRAGEE